MRKLSLLLLFLALLGLGLFVLFWIDQRTRAPLEEAPADEPLPVLPTETPQGLQVGGRTQFTTYDEVTKRAVLRGEADDSRRVDGVDVFEGVTLEVLDPEELGKVLLRLRAARARPRRTTAADELVPRWDERMDLEVVRAEVLAGTPLAPIVFETPQASIDLSAPGARRLTGELELSARSRQLALTGRGFLAELDQERFVIQEGGRIELLRPGAAPDAAPATLTAVAGALELRRVPGAEGAVILECREGAVLEPGAASPGRLSARHVLLTARPGAGPEEPLALDTLEADGAVDWTSGEARFQGERLTAAFAPEGRLERARLEGTPRAELALRLALDPARVPAGQEAARRVVVLEGQDSIDVTWRDGGYALHLESLPPAPGAEARVPTIITSDFTLRSAGTIDGWLSEDQGTARFEAGGGVIATSGEATLETARFVLALGPDERGETVLIGTASDGARLEGRIEGDPGAGQPARTFTLTSPEGLTLERGSRGWRVIEGTRVELALDGPGGFRARAERLEDFVVPRDAAGELLPEAVSFVARGNVEVELEQGVLAGEVLEVRGVKPVPRFVLRGTPEAKASFRGEAGQASALEIERTGDTLQARGEVTGSAVLGHGPGEGTHVTFSGDDLTLDRVESAELLPGERLRTVRVRVEGRVHGTVVADRQTLVFRCTRFSGESRTRLLAGGAEPVELGSLFLAEGGVHADFLDEESDLGIDCERFEIERLAGDVEAGFRQLTASGDVRFQGRLGEDEEIDVAGECEVFTLDGERRGSLAAGPSGRVALLGRVPGQKSPFRLGADHVDFRIDEEESLGLLALRPELRMLGLRARAEHLTADGVLGVVLSGAVRASGATEANVPFTLAADEVVLVGRGASTTAPGADDAGVPPEEQIDSLTARGGVDFQLADSLRGRGERLSVRRSTGLLRLEGQPASFELGSSRVETEWVEFDPVLQLLVGTGRGRLLTTPLGSEAATDWTLEFLSISSLLEPDSVVLVAQEPLFQSRLTRSSLRATWGILWLNRDGLEDLDRRGMLLDQLRTSLQRLRSIPEGAELIDVLALFRSAELGGLLREIYFEGPVEILAEGDLLARADAIYLDAASQHGWLARATVNLARQFTGQRLEKLIIKADWLRVSSDASLKADQATVTSCGYDDPHVKVVTGDMTIQPSVVDGETQYQLRLADNGIEMYDLLSVPLPTIEMATDEDFEPLWPTLGLANSARFGTLLSFAFTRPADRVGRAFDRLVRAVFGSRGTGKAPEPRAPASVPLPGETPEAAPPSPPPRRSDLDSNWKIDGSYLGSRGGLLDLGLEIESKERYWFDLYLGVVYDTGEDRGFIRVDEDERDSLRTWLRSQGYFPRDDSAWSFSYTNQSDAAVQSEFYEGRFLEYERAETYLQWRRSRDENFAQATVKVRLEDFRTDVEELPSLSGYRGRSPLFSFGSLQLLHTGDARAEYLRRRQGTEPHSPFGLPADFGDSDPDLFGSLDGFGERDILRLDTRQALELPLVLGHGFKLTPFVFARATGWSEGEVEDDTPTRLVAEAGARLGGSFWRRGARGTLHQFAPFLEYRNEFERQDEDGLPVEIDTVERFVTADVVRVGARTRLGVGERGPALDLDLAGAYAGDRSDGESDGWLPIEVFMRFLVESFGHEFTIFHEGRFDLEESRTDYSMISVGTHLGQQWGVQLSHQRGRDEDAEPLFEAASVAGLYRWTEKWEFEGRQSFSLLEDERLDSSLVLRRYAHDLVMDIEATVREGEGSSFGISVRPRFGYKPPQVGYVPW